MSKDEENRVRSTRKALGLTQKEVAKVLGVSHRTYQNWELAGEIPNYKSLQTLYERFGVNANYLVGLSDSVFQTMKPTSYFEHNESRSDESESAKPVSHSEEDDSRIESMHSSAHSGDDQHAVFERQLPYTEGEFCYIPFYGVRAEAGAGGVGEEKSGLPMAFRRHWVNEHLRSNFKNLFIIKVTGDSMEPTLNDGEIILVDKDIALPPHEDIYVLRLGDMLLIKRLQYIPPENQLKLISDNSNYAEITVSDYKELHILGRVRWRGGLL